MEDVFYKLADLLQSVLPQNWGKVLLYSEISVNSYDISFYCRVKGCDEYIQCYNLGQFGITESQIDNAFEKVYLTLKPVWTEAPKNAKWTNCTFSLESDGTFNLDLDYTDLTDCLFEHREQWKKKYLI